MFTARIASTVLDRPRIDPEFYSPEKLKALAWKASWRGKLISLEHLSPKVTDGTHVTPDYVSQGVRFLSSTNINCCEIDFENTQFITEQSHHAFEYASCNPRHGDLLIAKNGKIGTAAHYIQSNPPCSLFVSVALVRKPELIDRDYLAIFLNSKGGWSQFSRASKTGVITNLHLEEIREVEVLNCNSLVQKYIGDKVRHSGRLRHHSANLSKKQSILISYPEITTVLETRDEITNRVHPLSFNADRFDPKYYSKQSLALVKSISQIGGTRISDLCESMTNGFESRDFQRSGTPYLTVSEISSGRLDITSAPRISAAIPIPPKAKANRNCVLVVRGGSVGIAVKVFEWDESASISSDLIRLEFASEDTAAAVAAFLGSECGARLMKRASYGAVMPKLGQEELASILVPNSILSQGHELNALMKQNEMCIRLKDDLLICARQLVELLIEQKVTEDELLYAQSQLEKGNDLADRVILSRLFEGGWDAINTRPLFPDLDAYYETLRMVEREHSEVAAK